MALETLAREKSLKVETVSRVRSPSGYQHVKRQLQQCKNTHDVICELGKAEVPAAPSVIEG